jgi:hypothetical protein
VTLVRGAILSITTPIALFRFARLTHLHHVLEELRAAKDRLENTEHRFGAHKKEAIEAIRVAIEQVKICIDKE